MTETTPPAVWVDGDPLMEAIAAAVWERCDTSGGNTIVTDDPRNIAAVAAAVARAHAAVPSAPADRAVLLQRIAKAVQGVLPMSSSLACDVVADAVLAVLPEPVDRASLLREAAEVAVRAARGCGDSETGQYAASVAAGIGVELRRMADEAQQPASTAPLAAGFPLVKGNCPGCQRAALFLGSGGYVTCSNADCQEPDAASTVLEQYAAEAHPPEHSWAAELYDPLADEWAPGTRYVVRDRAVNALAHAKRLGPVWKDGTPVERRLVRATTTYTVEARQADTAGEQPAP